MYWLYRLYRLYRLYQLYWFNTFTWLHQVSPCLYLHQLFHHVKKLLSIWKNVILPVGYYLITVSSNKNRESPWNRAVRSNSTTMRQIVSTPTYGSRCRLVIHWSVPMYMYHIDSTGVSMITWDVQRVHTSNLTFLERWRISFYFV